MIFVLIQTKVLSNSCDLDEKRLLSFIEKYNEPQ